MSTPLEINEALRIYLGADPNGGISPPLESEARLQSAFPECYEVKLALLQRYIEGDADYEPDWNRHDLQSETDLFAQHLARKFPELDTISVRGLANRFAFFWR